MPYQTPPIKMARFAFAQIRKVDRNALPDDKDKKFVMQQVKGQFIVKDLSNFEVCSLSSSSLPPLPPSFFLFSVLESTSGRTERAVSHAAVQHRSIIASSHRRFLFLSLPFLLLLPLHPLVTNHSEIRDTPRRSGQWIFILHSYFPSTSHSLFSSLLFSLFSPLLPLDDLKDCSPWFVWCQEVMRLFFSPLLFSTLPLSPFSSLLCSLSG